LCQDISQSEFRIDTRQSAGPANVVEDASGSAKQWQHDATQQAARRRTPQSDVAPQPRKTVARPL